MLSKKKESYNNEQTEIGLWLNKGNYVISSSLLKQGYIPSISVGACPRAEVYMQLAIAPTEHTNPVSPPLSTCHQTFGPPYDVSSSHAPTACEAMQLVYVSMRLYIFTTPNLLQHAPYITTLYLSLLLKLLNLTTFSSSLSHANFKLVIYHSLLSFSFYLYI